MQWDLAPLERAHLARTTNVGQASRLPGRAKRGPGGAKAAPFGAAGQARRLPYVERNGLDAGVGLRFPLRMFTRPLRSLLVLSSWLLTVSANSADAPKPIDLWPGTAPGESKELGEEQDTTKPTDG